MPFLSQSGSWSEVTDEQLDAVQASIGRDSVWMVGELLDSLAIWPFVEHLGWTAAQVETLMQGVRAELEDESLRLYIPV